MNFKYWLNENPGNFLENIRFDQAKNIKKNIQQGYKTGTTKKYQPGTWGLEIEFNTDEGESEVDYEELQNALRDSSRVRSEFEKQVDSPESTEDWLDENPEPTEDDIQWDENDMIANYALAGGFEPLPPAADSESISNIRKLNDISIRFGTPLYSIAEEVRLFNAWNLTGIRRLHVNSKDDWESAKEEIAEAVATIRDEVSRLILHGRKEFSDIPDAIINRIKQIIADQESYISYYTEENESNPEKLRSEWEKSAFDHLLNKWQIQYDKVEKTWDKWVNGEDNAAFEEFISNITDAEASRYYDIELPMLSKDSDDKIQEYIDFLDSIGESADEGNATSDSWGVGPDGEEIIEIRTPIMTTKDFPALMKLLYALQGESFDGGTSAHVHIGMPQNTDYFDLIAMTTLADENAITKWAGKDRQFSTFANFNQHVHDKLAQTLTPGIYDANGKELGDAIEKIDRNVGTNLQAFKKQGTVEFRYLSSQLVDNPKKLIEFIQYYLLLPRLAQSRKQIKFNGMILTRLPNHQVKIEIGTSAPQPSESSNDLRKNSPMINFKYEEIKFLKNKGNVSGEFIEGMLNLRNKKEVRDANMVYYSKYKKYPTLDQIWKDLSQETKLAIMSLPIAEKQKSIDDALSDLSTWRS